MMIRPYVPALLALALPGLLVGCNSQLATVHGKIVCDGKPVAAGSVSFFPKPKAEGDLHAGRPASGAPDESGEFQLSTYGKNDGALIGTHVVTYLPPTPPVTVDRVLYEQQLKVYEKFGKCKLPAGYEVEVKPGRNEFVLDVTPRADDQPGPAKQ